MRRHIGLALLTAALSVLLTGCLFRSTEDLYALPERFPGYEDLTGKRSEIQAGLRWSMGPRWRLRSSTPATTPL